MSGTNAEVMKIASEMIQKPIKTSPDMFLWLCALKAQIKLDEDEQIGKFLNTPPPVLQRRQETIAEKPSSLRKMFPMDHYRVSIKKPNGTEKMGTMTLIHSNFSDRCDLKVTYDAGYDRVYPLKDKNPIVPMKLDDCSYYVNFHRQKSWRQLVPFAGYDREDFEMRVVPRVVPQ